jgi:hypothetical protein
MFRSSVFEDLSNKMFVNFLIFGGLVISNFLDQFFEFGLPKSNIVAVTYKFYADIG